MTAAFILRPSHRHLFPSHILICSQSHAHIHTYPHARVFPGCWQTWTETQTKSDFLIGQKLALVWLIQLWQLLNGETLDDKASKLVADWLTGWLWLYTWTYFDFVRLLSWGIKVLNWTIPASSHLPGYVQTFHTAGKQEVMQRDRI